MSTQSMSDSKANSQDEAPPPFQRQTTAPPPSWSKIFQGIRNWHWQDFFLRCLGASIMAIFLNCYVNGHSFSDLMWVVGLKRLFGGGGASSSCGPDVTIVPVETPIVQSFRTGCRALQWALRDEILDGDTVISYRSTWADACKSLGIPV